MREEFEETIEAISLRVKVGRKKYAFDIEIRCESPEETLILLAPNRIPDEKYGCVVVVVDPSDRTVKSANVRTVVHNSLLMLRAGHHVVGKCAA